MRDDYELSPQAIIHRHEASGRFEEAAGALIDFKFCQVSRNQGLLARLPYGVDGVQALVEATRMSWSTHRVLFDQWSDEKLVERAAGQHYLTHHAPDHDKVYVLPRTMDLYKSKGGGLYPGYGVEMTKATTKPVPCAVCGEPASWVVPTQCESCHRTLSGLTRLVQRPAGLELLLRTIGRLGLYELVFLLQGREQSDDIPK